MTVQFWKIRKVVTRMAALMRMKLWRETKTRAENFLEVCFTVSWQLSSFHHVSNLQAADGPLADEPFPRRGDNLYCSRIRWQLIVMWRFRRDSSLQQSPRLYCRKIATVALLHRSTSQALTVLKVQLRCLRCGHSTTAHLPSLYEFQMKASLGCSVFWWVFFDNFYGWLVIDGGVLSSTEKVN